MRCFIYEGFPRVLLIDFAMVPSEIDFRSNCLHSWLGWCMQNLNFASGFPDSLARCIVPS